MTQGQVFFVLTLSMTFIFVKQD